MKAPILFSNHQLANISRISNLETKLILYISFFWFMQWLPSIMLLLAIVMSFFISEPSAYLPVLIFGTYIGWIYLRYFQRKQETGFKGDPSDEFSFSTFFPEFSR